jgi:hypothetical protein
LPDSEDVDLDKVSGGGEDSTKNPSLNSSKISPKMETTPNYKVKYYKSPVTMPHPNRGTMTLIELKRRLQQSDEELKILFKMDGTTREALRSLVKKRDKLFQLILDLTKKK